MVNAFCSLCFLPPVIRGGKGGNDMRAELQR